MTLSLRRWCKTRYCRCAGRASLAHSSACVQLCVKKKKSNVKTQGGIVKANKWKVRKSRFYMHVTQPAVLLSFPRCEEAKECWPTSLTHRPSLAQCFSGCVVTGVVLLCEACVKQCHELLISAHDGKAFEAYLSLFFFAVFPLCFFHFVFRFLRSFTCCGAVHCQTCSLF